jgi:hypothetical protein
VPRGLRLGSLGSIDPGSVVRLQVTRGRGVTSWPTGGREQEKEQGLGTP